MRKAGLLMPVSALPSEYGIGDFGKECFRFIDFMEETGVRIWQILPLNPLGYGNSPYQPYSSYAGDEIYLDLESLWKEGLLEELPEPFGKDEEAVDYEKVREFKKEYLEQAFEAFQVSAEYEDFLKKNEWVEYYAVFLSLKKANEMKCWNEWKKEHRDWIRTRDTGISEKFKKEIIYEKFIQYLFWKQWLKVKKYAHAHNVEIMGDIPFYVGIDSLDVWMNQEEFLLGADGKPCFIAGVPPDYFSEEGQRWGNPIYDWEKMEKNGFAFWLDRIGYCAELFDIIRIDHFRAFDTYWKIPSSCPTAMEGEWIEAPGEAVFQKIKKVYPTIRIVAEDLGDMRPEVYELRDEFEFPGMKILQFTYDPLEQNNNFEDRENMIIYTGTHDNQMIKGWFEVQSAKVQKAVKKDLEKKGYKEKDIVEKFLHYTMDSIADTAILPVQDVLLMGDEGRMNTPGTLGSPNWEWRLADGEKLWERKEYLKKLICNSKR